MKCPDCGGPLAQAFPTTTAYDRCRRCGHVFPATEPEVELDAEEQREADYDAEEDRAFESARDR